MNIFKNNNNSSSNDYYNSYKEELRVEEEKSDFLSLRTIIKIETATIVAGIMFMGYSNFFSDFSKNFSIEVNSNLFMSQSVSQEKIMPLSDLELMAQLQEESVSSTTEPVKIIEEEKSKKEPVEMLAQELNMNFTDLSLIVEIIKSEMTTNSISRDEDAIVIGQL